MRRLIYKCRRFGGAIRLLGIVLGIIGTIIVLKIIPTTIWLFILGTLLICIGWIFFRLY
ncbi:MAG: hypothetical protein GX982_03270 [Tissierellia bacterium]|nr:hypothetical protein [Tissierellia bacterium]